MRDVLTVPTRMSGAFRSASFVLVGRRIQQSYIVSERTRRRARPRETRAARWSRQWTAAWSDGPKHRNEASLRAGAGSGRGTAGRRQGGGTRRTHRRSSDDRETLGGRRTTAGNGLPADGEFPAWGLHRRGPRSPWAKARAPWGARAFGSARVAQGTSRRACGQLISTSRRSGSARRLITVWANAAPTCPSMMR